MKPADIIFDLDGTLIDSSPGILASFDRILAAQGLQPAVKLDASLIGPPLADALRLVSGIQDERQLDRLAAAFKADYDTTGYRGTELFPGVSEGLTQLAQGGARLFIVTNKRMVPTQRILQALSLAQLFTGIHTRDETEPPAPSKSVVTRRILSHHRINLSCAFFVGDSEEDAIAARENGLAFIHARYGYGAVSMQQEAQTVLDHFRDLPKLVSRKSGYYPA